MDLEEARLRLAWHRELQTVQLNLGKAHAEMVPGQGMELEWLTFHVSSRVCPKMKKGTDISLPLLTE